MWQLMLIRSANCLDTHPLPKSVACLDMICYQSAVDHDVHTCYVAPTPRCLLQALGQLQREWCAAKRQSLLLGSSTSQEHQLCWASYALRGLWLDSKHWTTLCPSIHLMPDMATGQSAEPGSNHRMVDPGLEPALTYFTVQLSSRDAMPHMLHW